MLKYVIGNTYNPRLISEKGNYNKNTIKAEKFLK